MSEQPFQNAKILGEQRRKLDELGVEHTNLQSYILSDRRRRNRSALGAVIFTGLSVVGIAHHHAISEKIETITTPTRAELATDTTIGLDGMLGAIAITSTTLSEYRILRSQKRARERSEDGLYLAYLAQVPTPLWALGEQGLERPEEDTESVHEVAQLTNEVKAENLRRP